MLVQDGAHRAIVTVAQLNPATGDVKWTPDLAGPGDFTAATTVSSTDFDLAITRPGEAQPAETWTRLTLGRGAANYAVTTLNDLALGSKLVRATDPRAANAQTSPDTPGGATTVTLDGAGDGAVAANDFIGDESAHTGFRAFDPLDVQLVCTERSDPAIVNAGLDYCEERGDCMFVGSVPQGVRRRRHGDRVRRRLPGQEGVRRALRALDRRPRPARAGRRRRSSAIPPTGHVIGVFARIETTRGIFKAPAGDEARLLGALDVEYQLSDAEHTDLVELGERQRDPRDPGRRDRRRRLADAHTDMRWRYVNVRLLFNYVKSSLQAGAALGEAGAEPRQSVGRRSSTARCARSCSGCGGRAPSAPGEPDDVFTIIVDSTNNPPEEVDKGNFKLEVYFYPSKPAETILIVVGQQPSGATRSRVVTSSEREEVQRDASGR